MDLFVVKEGKKLRCGYTTGSCAAAAAKAATLMLLWDEIPTYVEIETPAGIDLKLKVENPVKGHDFASCCIVKDAGDDPDVTDNIEIYAEVRPRQDNRTLIDGGIGIGRITKEGFWGNVGDAAINKVPRQMILKEVDKVTKELSGVVPGLDIIIYAPMGQEIAKKTFNSNLGIEGGISIIGTKGIVEPMSDEALKQTIYLEIDHIKKNSLDKIILYPGNYGEKIVRELQFSTPQVKVSNYFGDAILYCHNLGFKKITIVGHLGKLCKLSIGCFNTHSKVCDVRMEAFVYYLALEGAPLELLNKIKEALTSEEALKICHEWGFSNIVSKMVEGAVKRIKRYVKDDELDVHVIMYSMETGVLD